MAAQIDHTARFRAYFNYLITLSRLIQAEHPSHSNLIRCMIDSKGFQKISSRKTVDQDGIAQSLRLSWYTELLLCKTIAYDEILPYATPWSMVQTYYAVYPAIRSYFMATGRTVGKSHASTLGTIGSDFVSCKGRFPLPWCSVYAGDPSGSSHYLANTHGSIPVTLSNPLKSAYHGDPWQHYGLFLKTTRERSLARKIEDWKKDKSRKHIKQEERALLLKQLRPTHIFDALYRVRARSNYHDIDSFAFASIHGFDYRELQAAMCQIVDATLAVFETMVAKALGKKQYGSIVNEFSLTPLGNNRQETYWKRWCIIEQLL